MSTKTSIISFLECCDKENFAKISMLSKTASLKDYEHLTRTTILTDTKLKIWSDALQSALNENEIATIPAQDNKYYIDKTIIIPSNRRSIADKKAHMSLTAQTNVLMLRNEHTQDGTHFPIKSGNEDCNIPLMAVFGMKKNLIDSATAIAECMMKIEVFLEFPPVCYLTT